MKMPLVLFPEWIKKQYNLDTHAVGGFVFLEIRHVVWGLSQAGILANKLLQKWLAPHILRMCEHAGIMVTYAHLITFSLVIDNFGVKYVGKEHAKHLIKCLKEKYKLNKDWAGDLYCGTSLK
jgi:hypothetical protein